MQWFVTQFYADGGEPYAAEVSSYDHKYFVSEDGNNNKKHVNTTNIYAVAYAVRIHAHIQRESQRKM